LNQLSEKKVKSLELTGKITSGVVWTTAASVIIRVISLATNIVLAGLLLPKDFGLMAVAMAFISITQGVTQTGFSSAIIQAQEGAKKLLNSVWTVELVKNLALFFALFMAAPFFGAVMNENAAVDIIRAMSFTFIFVGLNNVGVVLFRKELNFARQFLVDTVPILINIIIVLPLAIYLQSVWALVIGYLVSSVAMCIFTYLIHDYRPRLDFDITKIKRLSSFGLWIFGTSIIGVIREQGIVLLLGSLFGISALGLYNRATVFSINTFRQINDIIWKVGYPAFSILQNKKSKLITAYRETTMILLFFGIPLAFGLFSFSDEFVILFLTEEWDAMGDILKILSLASVATMINTPAFILFQASGLPRINLELSLYSILILTVCLLISLSASLALNGFALSIFASTSLIIPITLKNAAKVMNIPIRHGFKLAILPLLMSLLMAMYIQLFKSYIIEIFSLSTLLINVVNGIVFYYVLYRFVEFRFSYNVKLILINRIGGFLSK
jgi:O-antigen/teichoic acid export membrane protein